MDEMFGKQEKQGRFSPVFIVGALVGVIAIGGIIYLLSQRPSIEDQTAQILAGASREGTPEFAELNKDILIETDENTVESPTGLGTISMFIRGNILNRSKKTIKALEVNVKVIDLKRNVLKERNVLVVPVQRPELGPGERMQANLTLDGFPPKSERAQINWKVTAIKAE